MAFQTAPLEKGALIFGDRQAKVASDIYSATGSPGLEEGVEELPYGLVLKKDGDIILEPQPSSDPNDPLNWPQARKHILLAVVSFVSFLPEFTSAIGIPALLPQAQEWNLPINTIQHSLVGNIFMLSSGGIIVVALSGYFGRLPVLFYFQTGALATCIWCSRAQTFKSFLASRVLNGFFATAAQSGGLMFIQDMFFFHEHPRKINIWAGLITISPYIGPFMESFIIWQLDWRWGFYIATILHGIGLLLVVSLMDETFYNRSIPPEQQPRPVSRLLRLLGIEQMRARHVRGNFWRAVGRPAVAITKIPVVLTVAYFFLNFAWVIGVNVTVVVWLNEIYRFNFKDTGLFYFSGIAGVLLGWLVGHWLHDAVGRLYARRRGHIAPEARLIVNHLAAPLLIAPLALLGYALELRWHYMAIAVCFALQVVGITVATVGVDAYLLDAYPEGSGEVGALVNFGRALSGFMAVYVQLAWVQRAGTEAALGTQAGIAAASSLVIIFLQLFGRRLREWQGPMEFGGRSAK